jgi:hypothetical protein
MRNSGTAAGFGDASADPAPTGDCRSAGESQELPPRIAVSARCARPLATYRGADLSNPNIKPWAIERMRKPDDVVLNGGIGYTARSSCMPASVPGVMMFVVKPIFFVQSPKEVLMNLQGDMTAKTSNPPVRPEWVHQIKHDGYRTIVAPMRAGLALRASCRRRSMAPACLARARLDRGPQSRRIALQLEGTEIWNRRASGSARRR